MELLNVPTIGSSVGAAKVLLLDGVTVKESACTSAGRALIAGADDAAQRQTLGLGSLATLSSIDISTNTATGILPIAKGGTGTNSGLPYGSVKDLTWPSILGRKTNSTGNAELLSASDVLNMIGTTRGSILYRGESGWLELAPGTSGYALVTQGPNANPAWGTVTASVSNGDKGDITVSNSGGTWTIDNDVVTYAKIQNVSANKVLGRGPVGPGDVQEIDCTAAGRAIIAAADATSQRAVLELVEIATTGSADHLQTGTVPAARFPALTGEVTSQAGTVNTTIAANAVTTNKIANDNVTYAKIQNVAASRILGRKTNSVGDVEECTLSEVLDLVGSAAQGDILYRNATGWTRLGAGTANHFLKTNGPNQNPSWAAVGGSSASRAVLQFSDPAQTLRLGIRAGAPIDAWPFLGYGINPDSGIYTAHRITFNPTSYQLSIVMVETIESASSVQSIPNPVGLTLQVKTNTTGWTDVVNWDLRQVLGFAHTSGSLSLGSPTEVFFRIVSYNQTPDDRNLNQLNLALMVWN